MLNVCWGFDATFHARPSDYSYIHFKLHCPHVARAPVNSYATGCKSKLPAERATSTNSMVPTELQPR